MKVALKHDLWSFYFMTGVGIAIFTILSVGALGLQQRIFDLARGTRHEMVPAVHARVRVVRNIELLRSIGSIAYRTTDQRVLQEAGFLSTLLSTHPNVEIDAATVQLLREANDSIQWLVKGQVSLSHWPQMDRRLGIHSDRMSISVETLIVDRALRTEQAAVHTRNFAWAQALLFFVCVVAIVAWGRVLSTRMKAKDRYFNELSHDFRQRVHSMQLSLGGVNQGLPERVDTQLVRVQTLMSDLQRYLDNFLDITRMETVVVKPVAGAVVVSQLFQKLALQLEAAAEHYQVDLRFRHSSLTLHTDEKWVRRVLENLIVNALKFSRGKVLVVARRRGQDVELAVFDNGEGLLSADAAGKAIFESFAQGPNARRIADHGYGLGLAMVKRTVALLNGRFEVRSAPGRGTCVRVRFPAAL
ncbi:HAMP domain-containing histidine kinase [Aquabacterium sp. A7-Y]|uniref:sensor histidine kinase n=1 Tax=Aquabacterium sp. A7-Y TaxID=1349605 RepID=UPI00223DC4D5|nr:HAMP domain-containing sensor histidine kinase [Aquabacterium sp. A7-Y]MCW7540120.1 HAMP domain-containing histidine kinase [Aquabacterium sp. A7-Y]